LIGQEVFDGLLSRCETAAGAIALGLSRAALEAAVRHSKARIQFGKPLAEMEATQNKLADMNAGIQSARLLVYKAALSLKEAKSAGPQSAMAKLTASELALEICREAVQIHGGYGYVKDYPVERCYRDALFCQIYPTVNEIQRRAVAQHTLRTIR
jgi:alkylation response protein AidB-like acyl-CoA dehydrogenase